MSDSEYKSLYKELERLKEVSTIQKQILYSLRFNINQTATDQSHQQVLYSNRSLSIVYLIPYICLSNISQNLLFHRLFFHRNTFHLI